MLQNLPTEPIPISKNVAKKIIDILETTSLIFDYRDLEVIRDYDRERAEFKGDTYNDYVELDLFFKNDDSENLTRGNELVDSLIQIVKKIDGLYPLAKVNEVNSKKIRIYILNTTQTAWAQQLREAIFNV